MLQFCSSNETHQPLVKAIEVLKRYVGIPGTYYPPDEHPPIDGVVRPMWQDLVHEKDPQGEWRVNRVNYELCVLEAIRDKLRCRELWVVGANKYRNPDDDLPHDFEDKREQYYYLFVIASPIGRHNLFAILVLIGCCLPPPRY